MLKSSVTFACLLSVVFCTECDVHYQCMNENEVVLNKMHFVCPENFICNDDESSCSPCVRAKCNKDFLQYACDLRDERLVRIGKYGVSCVNGYKCNRDFISPCEPCISKYDDFEQPFVQPKNATLLTNLLPRAITVPDADLINCNDGNSFWQPCRPGAANANYYFKCTLTWNLQYALNIRPCNTLYLDKLCGKFSGLCQPPEV